MLNFFEKIGRFVVNLMIVGLILLVGIQIVMKNDTAQTTLNNLEMTIKSYFRNTTQNLIPAQKVVQVKRKQDHNYLGTITIDLLQDLSLSQVWVKKNGIKVANFARGYIKINVKKGDFITINSRHYSKTLWFEITNLSTNIGSFKKGQQFRTSGTIVNLGIVRSNNRL